MDPTPFDVFHPRGLSAGDLAVDHGNGRIELKDRSKDIIISGGENISSIQVRYPTDRTSRAVRS